MTGTTGLASAYNTLYVANNKVITISDQYGTTEDVKHDFDWVTAITASELFLFGIYNKNNTYGIFSLDFASQIIKTINVAFTPVNLIYVNELLVVLDSDFKTYEYARNLSLQTTKARDAKVSIENPIKFMTIGLAKNEYVLYYSKDKDVFSEKEKLFSAEGNILSLQYYDNYLFVIYVSLYNHYSVLQYDLINKKNVKTIEGGYISGPPIYSCIYEDTLYISASTNNKIEMTMFDFPGKKVSEVTRPPTQYSLFELNKINHRFLTEQVNIDTEKIKNMKDTGEVDTTPAKNTLMRYYIWSFICFFIVIVIFLAMFFQENSVLPVLLLSILFIALSFLIKNTIPI